MTLGCLLAPPAVVAVWASQVPQDTDRYVETVSPLAHDAAVQAAVTDRVTAAIVSRLDVAELVEQAVARLQEEGLPDRVSQGLEALAVPVADGVEGFTRDQVAKVVESDRFAEAWDQANRVAHEQVVQLLSGEGGGVVSADGAAVVVDLGPVVERVKERLADRGFGLVDRLPQVSPTLTVAEAPRLPLAQQAYRLLVAAGTWLPALSLTLLGLGVYVAQGHRRALLGAGLGVGGAMLGLGVGLLVARAAYLEALPETASRGAATVVFDTLVRFLRDGLRATAVAGLLVALLAFFSGESVTARTARGAVVGGIGRLRRRAESMGLRTGPVGAWTYTHRRAVRAAVAALAVATVVFWTNPTAAVVAWVAVLALVLLAVVELLARPTVVADGEPPDAGSWTAARIGAPPRPAPSPAPRPPPARGTVPSSLRGEDGTGGRVGGWDRQRRTAGGPASEPAAGEEVGDG